MKGNKYIINEKYAEMIIESKVHGIIKVKIDKEDLEKCSKLTWHYAKNKDSKYIQSRIKDKMVKLHRFVMDINDKNLVVDHINRNPLDNRKSNLRICSYKENSFNKSIRVDNTSGIVGVDFHKINKKWRAKIKYNNITIHLGYFEDINEASINRRVAEEILFGEYSPNGKLDNVSEELIERARENVMNRIEKKIA
ncbi:MAG: HNH endonuclease [Clostridium sp.]|uniref:HNH endonuclease n=1 Tax=Clostridium sp. TaxID=1506 RepID=UPI0025B98919|nr:HNH endonuclease [Clostridium sp.]MBS4956556.1 HNH endonuclease [Clostridium sp.]